MCGDGTNDVGALKHAHCGKTSYMLSFTVKDGPSQRSTQQVPLVGKVSSAVYWINCLFLGLTNYFF